MNHITLIGRLCADPELRYTQSGTAVASLTIAVDRTHTSQGANRETDFIPVVVWQKLAEVVAQHLKKGRLVAVEGRLQIRTYDNRDGQKMKVAEVIAQEVQFLDKAPQQDASQDRVSTGAKSENKQPRYQDDPFVNDPFADQGAPFLNDDNLPF